MLRRRARKTAGIRVLATMVRLRPRILDASRESLPRSLSREGLLSVFVTFPCCDRATEKRPKKKIRDGRLEGSWVLYWCTLKKNENEVDRMRQGSTDGH